MPPPFGSHVSGGVPVGVCCAVVLGTAFVVVAATVGVVPMMVLVDRVGVVAALAVDEATVVVTIPPHLRLKLPWPSRVPPAFVHTVAETHASP